MTARRVFVVGASGAAKTPFARLLADALGGVAISASDGVREVLAPIEHLRREDRLAFVTEASRRSVEALRRDPDIVVRHLRERLSGLEERPVVLEGFRNPRDFAHLFDWRRDVAVSLVRDENPVPSGAFEAGLDVIAAYLKWATEVGILDAGRWIRCAHATDDLEDRAAEVVVALRALVATPEHPSQFRE
ncbi:MAG: hypothetical protein AB7N76_25935 [Planctomycetota bacterium]